MIEIRLLSEKDVCIYETDLLRYMKMVLEENIEQTIPFEMIQKYVNDMKAYTHDGSAILMGAFDGDKLVGFHWGYIIKNINEVRIHSYHNALDYEYRGQKIGSRFFTFLEEEAKKREIYIIEAMCTYSNKIAVNYHLHNGFEIERLKVKKVLKHE